MSQAKLEKKVKDYLCNSPLPEDYWQRPITAEQLQAEIDRVAGLRAQLDDLGALVELGQEEPGVDEDVNRFPRLVDQRTPQFERHG